MSSIVLDDGIMGWSGRTAAVAVLVALIGLSANCGAPRESTSRTNVAWAAGAVERIEDMEGAYDSEDAYATALFYTAGGTLDLTVFHLGIATTPQDVVERVDRLWHQIGNRADVRAEHVFVTLDGAIVWWFAFDSNGIQVWAQTYAFAGDRTTSRAFRGLEWPLRWLDPVDESIMELVSDYVAAWSAGDAASLSSVYATGATINDPVRGHLLTDFDQMANVQPESIDRGPWPEVFAYRNGDHVEAIVVVQIDGDCPMLEARRWVLVDGLISHETRYVHVPSGRRCLADPPDGWWASYEPIEGFEDNVTEIVDVAGVAVELVNAEPVHERFARWLTARFVHAGLPPAEVGAIWFPPSPDCDGPRGLAFESYDRFDGSMVVLCYSDSELERPSESGWNRSAAAVGFHELAHIWFGQHLDEDARRAFMERVGVDTWRNGDTRSHERGVELAADTIAWGLGGTSDAIYMTPPPPDCRELAARFELLTGRQPLTRCDDVGGTP